MTTWILQFLLILQYDKKCNFTVIGIIQNTCHKINSFFRKMLGKNSDYSYGHKVCGGCFALILAIFYFLLSLTIPHARCLRRCLFQCTSKIIEWGQHIEYVKVSTNVSTLRPIKEKLRITCMLKAIKKDISLLLIVETDAKKKDFRPRNMHAFIEKSTIFIKSSWKSLKIANSWVS